MKYKPVFIGIAIAITLFLTFYFIQDWASNVPGERLDGQWQLEISQEREGFLRECEEQVVTIPYHEITGKPFYARFSKNFDGTFTFLVLPFISSSGYKVYLNDSLIAQVGDPENKTPNVWNHVQVLSLDQNTFKQAGNKLTIEIYALFTYGIDKSPVLTNYSDTYVKVYIENLFRTYIPFISIGAAILLGVILIVLGISYQKTRKLFLYLGLCMFLSGIYIFEQRYRITTGSLQTLLWFRKIASGSGFFATWFLLAAMELYTTNKMKISKLLFMATTFVVIFSFLQPDIASFSNWIANLTFLNIITILTAAILLLVNPKGKEWLIAPIFFLCLTFIHYLVTWHLLRMIGPNLSDIGLLFGSIGFGLILIVHFKELVRENLWMEKKNDELEVQKNEAIKLAEMKSEVVAQTSHEIRNPLMGIMGMADKLLLKGLDEETEKAVHTIKTCSLNLQDILNDILDAAKIEAGKFVLHVSSFSLTQFLSEFDHTYSVLTTQKGIEWKIERDENCPEYIKSDRLRLSQILNNLLSNAVKFTEKGKVTLQVNADENKLIFYVVDTGTGIEKTLQEQIFDPYFRLENNRYVVGTGLGLSIVKKLVKSFGGNLSLFSEKGKGSTFSVAIPYERSYERQFDLPVEQLQKLKVLIADDSKINLEVLTNYLTDMGFKRIHKVFEGLQAFKEVQKNNYQLVIIDINMPGMTGTEIVEKIRQENIRKDTVFVALTGMDISETAVMLKSAGFNDVLGKPLSKKQLFNTIQTLLSERLKKERNAIPEEIKQKLIKANIDEETLMLILREFLNEVPPAMKKIHQGIQNADYEQIYSGIHYLKSSLDYLGTGAILKMRAAIEKAGKEKDMKTIKANYRKFEEEIMQLRHMYQSYLSSFD